MTKLNNLIAAIENEFTGLVCTNVSPQGEVTLDCKVENLKSVLRHLKTHENFYFDQLIDVCGVDYLLYGISEWETEAATENGFSRGVEWQQDPYTSLKTPRFVVVYHLLSTQLNHRLRVKVYLDDSQPVAPSVHDIWKVANWFEREAYDLYGILFTNHPDLRRILTDYGFIGHPFL